ncbi:MAG: carboxypeptidase-like regulatory domain-containing protein [bacterium]
MFRYLGKIIAALIIISMAITCRNPFGPNEGTLVGVVTDNNGNVVVSAKVTVERIHAKSGDTGWSNNPDTETTTDAQGRFFLHDVPIDLVKIKATKTGLTEVIKIEDINQDGYWSCDKPSVEVELSMEGAPTIISVAVVPTTASISTNDLIDVSAIVTDNYTTNTYSLPTVQVVLHSQESKDSQQVYPLTTNSTGASWFFEASFYASELLAGTFGLEFSAIDADGNQSNTLTTTLNIVP